MPARPALRDTATLFYCAGAFMAMAAYFSGLSAAQGTPVSPEESAAVTAHFTWADRTTWFFVFFASLRVAFSYIWRPTARWPPDHGVCSGPGRNRDAGGDLPSMESGSCSATDSASPPSPRPAHSCGPYRTPCPRHPRPRRRGRARECAGRTIMCDNQRATPRRATLGCIEVPFREA